MLGLCLRLHAYPYFMYAISECSGESERLASSPESWLLPDGSTEIIIGPRRDKTCPRGFRQSEFQTSLLSYRDKLENLNFTCSKCTYDSFQKSQ